LLYIIWRARRGDFGPEYYGPVEVMGLYWHFVDIVWIFLFPFLYLIPHFGVHHGSRTQKRARSTAPHHAADDVHLRLRRAGGRDTADLVRLDRRSGLDEHPRRVGDRDHESGAGHSIR